jgi:C-terminal processing protease CtpA/Prc
VFIDHPITYAKASERSGFNHDEFGPWNNLTVNSMSNYEPYIKNIALLVNNRTESASDHFTYIFKHFRENTVIIGDTTGGCFSGIYPFRILPNGWIYTFSSQLTLSLDNVALDSLGGVAPDIYVDNSHWYNWKDTVLGTAINYLEKK